jgi:rhomboid protease GluP
VKEPEKPTLAQRIKAAPVTFAFAAANIAWFVWMERHGSSYDGDVLIRFGAVDPLLVRSGEWWRVASYMFVHIGWAHLLLNTWAGSTWAAIIEPILGHLRFFALYMLAGIGGGVAVVLFSDAVTAGASGALFGVIGAALVVRYRILGTFQAWQADRMVRSVLGQIALWTLLGLVALPMSNAGHFGGLVTGVLVTLFFTRHARVRVAVSAS